MLGRLSSQFHTPQFSVKSLVLLIGIALFISGCGPSSSDLKQADSQFFATEMQKFRQHMGRVPVLNQQIGDKYAEVMALVYSQFIDELARKNLMRQISRILTKMGNDLAWAQKSDDEVFDHLINQLLADIDHYSSYFSPNAFRLFRGVNQGNFSGIGLEVKEAPGRAGALIIAPLEGSPAEKAGLQTGDVIKAVDGISLVGLDFARMIVALRGVSGTVAELVVEKHFGHDHNTQQALQNITKLSADDDAGDNNPLAHQPINLLLDTITLYVERSALNVPSVRSRYLNESNLGYIRISYFNDKTAQETKDNMNKLAKIPGKTIKGWIVDLRQNPGGVLQEAVEIADYFLTAGTVVIIQERGNERVITADEADLSLGLPVVILQDQGSASAAEVLSAALNHNDRAMIVGQKSFGKGLVQSVFPLSDGSGLKLTSARYLGPTRASVAKGITPTIIAEDKPETTDDEILLKAIQALAGAL